MGFARFSGENPKEKGEEGEAHNARKGKQRGG
jgi:hypothetical protein